MVESTTDHSILKNIEGLVDDDRHLYRKEGRTDHDQLRWIDHKERAHPDDAHPARGSTSGRATEWAVLMSGIEDKNQSYFSCEG